jgi:hypothetical protein
MPFQIFGESGMVEDEVRRMTHLGIPQLFNRYQHVQVTVCGAVLRAYASENPSNVDFDPKTLRGISESGLGPEWMAKTLKYLDIYTRFEAVRETKRAKV